LRELADRTGASDTTFEGFVDQHSLPERFAAADLFAFPTLEDPFGIVLLEAAATGLPVVASSRAGVTADLVRDGVNGLVADPDDVAGFARLLVELTDDPSSRRRLGQAAHETTLERTPQAAARGYLEAIVAVRGARGGARPVLGRGGSVARQAPFRS
jgi:glycosyltransferase involved in cell wall biosynthesis